MWSVTRIPPDGGSNGLRHSGQSPRASPGRGMHPCGLSRPLRGSPLERVAEWFRFALEVVRVELIEREAGLLDALRDSASEVAPAGEALVERLQAPLPFGDAFVRRVTVLYEVEGAIRLQHASDLLECVLEIRDRAQGPRREDGVEALRRQVEALTSQSGQLDSDWRSVDPGFCDSHADFGGLDGRHLREALRIERSVEARSESDLHDVTVQALTDTSAYWVGGLAAHDQILEPR